MNILTVGHKDCAINNPTYYFPNKIVGDYFATPNVFGRSVDEAYANERAMGYSEQQAVQNLFTRAVQSVEYQANLNKLSFFLNLLSLYNHCRALANFEGTISIEGPAIVFILCGVLLYYKFITFCNAIIAQILLVVIDAFGNFGQYSI